MKTLNEAGVVSELAGSGFFAGNGPSMGTVADTPQVVTPLIADVPTVEPASRNAGKQDGELASALAAYPAALIEDMRRMVKLQGKEVSFVRMTAEEKSELADIVYRFKRQGLNTSENEVNRIAVNFLLEDYRMKGEQSLLARVLEALSA